MVNLNDIKDAAERIKPYVIKTPLVRAWTMDELLGCQVYLKSEMLQVTGSFKIRGATNITMSLTDEEKAKGLICSSSGNHGRAMAYLGKLTGTKIVVVLPDDSPKVKADKIRELGGEVVLGPRLYDDRWKMVNEEQRKHGYTIAHAYEDYRVMAGQGTIGLEILEDLPDVDVVVVPIGGGGLISGVATAIKAMRPNVRIVGVQAKAADAYVKSREAGHPVEVACVPSLADGIICRKPGNNPYPIIEQLVDEVVSVTEDDIKAAVKMVAGEAHLVAEPTSCVGIAAIIGGELKVQKNEKVAFILTSGNWDIDNFGKILNDEFVEGSW